MDAAGIEKALFPAQVAGTWQVSYETVAELCSGHPDRLYGMAGLDPEDIMEGVRKLEYGIKRARLRRCARLSALASDSTR